MIKLVVSDLDGTLLNSDKEVSEENILEISRLRNLGIKFCICTGRIYASAKIVGDIVGNDFPIIACNGAYISDGDKVISKYIFDKETIYKIIDILSKYDITFHFYDKDTMYSNKLEFSARKIYYKYLNQEEKPIKVVVSDNLKVFVDKGIEVYKFIIFSTDENIREKICRDINYIDGVYTTQSESNNIEIMGNGISKGSAVEKIKDLYGIKKEEVFVIGDQMNDCSMFDTAKYTIAMGNAIDELKNKALFVTKENDESGFAYAVKKFIEEV